MPIKYHQIRGCLDQSLFINAKQLILEAFDELIADQSLWRFFIRHEPRFWDWEGFRKISEIHLEIYHCTPKMAVLRAISFLQVSDKAAFRKAKTELKAEHPEKRTYHAMLDAYELLDRFRKTAESKTQEAEQSLRDRANVKLTMSLLTKLYHEARIGIHKVQRGPGRSNRAENRARQKKEATRGRIRRNFEAFAYDLRDMLGSAIFLKPSPPSTIDPHAVCFFGGKPKMPPEMEWPCSDPLTPDLPLHFLAQIDCASLPRELTVGDISFPTPDFPKTGTFFLFMHLDNDEAWNLATRLIYRSDDTTTFVERDPPENLFSMLPEHHEGLARKYHTCEVEKSAIQPCGKLLVRQVLTPVPFLSINRAGIGQLRDAYNNEQLQSDERLQLLLEFIGISDKRARDEKPKPASKHNFGDYYGQNMMQMFGLGGVVQYAPIENADKIMMMQIGACSGLPLKLGGSTGLFQYWMDEDDLIARRFETIFVTGEMT